MAQGNAARTNRMRTLLVNHTHTTSVMQVLQESAGLQIWYFHMLSGHHVPHLQREKVGTKKETPNGYQRMAHDFCNLTERHNYEIHALG